MADDTNLFTSGINLIELAKQVNEELEHISLWLKINKLSLNIKKTHFMVFTSKKQIEKVSVSIDGHPIDEEKSTKFLGVHIDNKLTWKKHIKHVESKVSRGIGIVYRARHVLNSGTMKMLYYSFVYPYFSYFFCMFIKFMFCLYRSPTTARLVISLKTLLYLSCPTFPQNAHIAADVNEAFSEIFHFQSHHFAGFAFIHSV